MFEYIFGRYLASAYGLNQVKLASLIGWSRAEYEMGEDVSFPSGDEEAQKRAIKEIERLDDLVSLKLSELIAEYDPSPAPPPNADNSSSKKVENALSVIFFKGLTRENVFPFEKLLEELKNFEKHYDLDKDGVSRVFVEEVEAVFASFIDSRDYFANRYATILLKYIMRFIGSEINFSTSSGAFSYSAERMAVQKVVTGDARYFIGIGGEKLALQKFNDALKSSFASSGTNGGWRGRYDALLTFLNCVSCIFQSMIEKEKEILLVDAPAVYKYSTVSANERCFLLPVSAQGIKVDLLIGLGQRPNFATISHNL